MRWRAVHQRTGKCRVTGLVSRLPDHDSRPPSVRRRAPRPARPRPARGRDRAAGSRAVRRTRGFGQDHDAGRAGGMARGRRGGPRIDLHRRVQQARGRGADGTPGRGAGNPWRCSRLREGPDVPRPRPRDPRATRASPWSRWRTGTRCCATCSPASRGRIAGGWTSRSRGSSWTCGSPRTRWPRTRRPGRSPVRSSPTRAPSGSRAASTSTTCWCARSRACTGTPACSRAGGRARRGCSWTRPRTWTAPSWSWRCCSPHRRTTSSWSATTTRRCTRGAWRTCGGSSGWPPRCRACAGWISRPTTGARHRSWPAP